VLVELIPQVFHDAAVTAAQLAGLIAVLIASSWLGGTGGGNGETLVLAVTRCILKKS
jgi:hypothetical protein